MEMPCSCKNCALTREMELNILHLETQKGVPLSIEIVPKCPQDSEDQTLQTLDSMEIMANFFRHDKSPHLYDENRIGATGPQFMAERFV